MIIEVGFLDHYKTRKLQRLGGAEAVFGLIRLWEECQKRRKWIFVGLSPEDLEDICRFKDAKTLLITAGFIENNENRIIVHDWEKANGNLVASWENGLKGGRPRRSKGKPMGSAGFTPEVTQPSTLSNLSKNGEVQGGEAWIKELQKSPAYAGIDVPREYHRMIQWCEVKKLRPSKLRFIRWLNRVDQPLLPVKKPEKEPLF